MLRNHLWQSTIFAAVVWLLTTQLRRNRAAVRYWLWFAASVKFLVPFSLMVSAGSQIPWKAAHPATIAAPQFVRILDEIAAPASRIATATPAASPLSSILLSIWLVGFLLSLVAALRSWLKIRAARRAALPLPWPMPIPALSTPARLEPGIFGIVKPVLLLPEGIVERLSPAQLEAVMAHELAHVRRRDNLTAAIHLAVESIFWFHPLLWWIRERLVEERERACDEEVLRAAADPHDYAEAILSVCKLYVESPLACASGITGAGLKKRLEAILTHRPSLDLTAGGRFLLAAAAVLAVAAPIAIGIASAPPVGAQTNDATVAFEVASVKPNQSGVRGGQLNTEGGTLTATNIPLATLIRAAYGVQRFQVAGLPGWAETERFDVVAKAAHAAPDRELMQMLCTLLADRFRLSVRRELKDLAGYALVVGKGGPKLREMEAAGQGWIRNGPGSLTGKEVSMPKLADALAGRLSQPVTDETGIKGVYDLKLEWTPGPGQVNNPAEVKEPQTAESGSDIFAALQQQLGLKLDARKVPGEWLVIDHVERPTEN